jgi:hypothetical protein
MKLGTWAAALLVCAGPTALAHGESLGDAAKRERERREKNKEQQIELRVLDDSDLAAAPSDGGKGTFNEGTTGGRKPSPPEGAPPPSAPMPPDAPGTGSPLLPPGGGALLDAPQAPRSSGDYRRDSARNALYSAYRSMASSAARLVKDAKEYQGCTTSTVSGSRCVSLARNLTRLATSLSDSMEAAEALAHAGRVTPGEVRETQERCGSGVDWSAAERLINQYRKR